MRPIQSPDCADQRQEDPAAAVEGRGGRGAVIYSLVGLVIFLIALIGVVVGARQVRRMMGPHSQGRSKTVAEWIHQLEQGPDDEARREAAAALTRLGPEAVVEALATTSEVSADGNSYSMVVAMIPALAAAGPEVVDALLAGLESDKENVRLAAANVLRAMGPEAKGAVAPLAVALGDRNRWVRWFSAEALGNIGPDAAGAVEALRPLVEHPDRHTRIRAVRALGRIGPAARAAVAALTKAEQDDPERAVRQAAKLALYQIDLDQIASDATGGATDEVQALIKRLADADEFESASAAKELARVGPAAVDAVPALAKALGHRSKWVREAAAETLGTLGRSAETVVPALRRAAEDEEPEVRAAAKRALEKIEGKPRRS